MTATGYPSSTFTESGALPGGVTLSSSGVLSGTPAAGTVGNYPITITADDGVGSDGSQNFTLTVLNAGDAVYYYFGDELGSSRVLTDSNGDVCYDTDFYPFGAEHGPYVFSCSQNYKFTGKERDTDSAPNLDYSAARHYAFTYARFMSADPANAGADPANPQSWNMYSYTLDNPLNATDPSGLCSMGQQGTTDGYSQDEPGVDNPNDSICSAQLIPGFDPDVQNSTQRTPTSTGHCNVLCQLSGVLGLLFGGTPTPGGDDWNDYLHHREIAALFVGASSGVMNISGTNNTQAAGNSAGQPSCGQSHILNAIPGAAPSTPAYDVNQGGHEQFGINTTADQLRAAGFAPFSFFGANGYRNRAFFWSVHVNGQYGAELTSNGPFTNVQGHIDMFNPSRGLLGKAGHGVVDLAIGSLAFNHSNALDPSCHL